MPKQLRQLFAYILAFCEVHNPGTLWKNHNQSMTEDFLRQEMPKDKATQRALRHIKSILVVNGVRLADFGLLEPVVRHIFDDEPAEPKISSTIKNKLR